MKLIDRIANFINNYRKNTSPAVSAVRYGVQPGIVVPFPQPAPKYRNTLLVRLTGNGTLSQTINSWEGDDILQPWDDFITWYEETDTRRTCLLALCQPLCFGDKTLSHLEST